MQLTIADATPLLQNPGLPYNPTQSGVPNYGIPSMQGTDALGGYMAANAKQPNPRRGILPSSYKLFRDLLTSEGTSGLTLYTALAINTDTALSALNIWFGDPTGASHTAANGSATYAFGLDPAAANVKGAVIATQTAAPAGVSFSAPTPGAPLAMGALTAGQSRILWVRQTVAASTTPQQSDWLLATFQLIPTSGTTATWTDAFWWRIQAGTAISNIQSDMLPGRVVTVQRGTTFTVTTTGVGGALQDPANSQVLVEVSWTPPQGYGAAGQSIEYCQRIGTGQYTYGFQPSSAGSYHLAFDIGEDVQEIDVVVSPSGQAVWQALGFLTGAGGSGSSGGGGGGGGGGSAPASARYFILTPVAALANAIVTSQISNLPGIAWWNADGTPSVATTAELQSVLGGGGIFPGGSGLEGNITIDSGSGNMTLGHELNAYNLTIVAPYALVPNGHNIKVKGMASGNGTISWHGRRGGDGNTTAEGLGATAITLAYGHSTTGGIWGDVNSQGGQGGGATAPAAGGPTQGQTAGGRGGQGGSITGMGGTAGGLAGAVQLPLGTSGALSNVAGSSTGWHAWERCLAEYYWSTASGYQWNGGTGGGGGAGPGPGGASNGGGGGSGGGFIVASITSWDPACTWLFDASGGDGGNAAADGTTGYEAGGGGGGGGGSILLCSGSTPVPAGVVFDVSGGTGGLPAAGPNGNISLTGPGANGSNGTVLIYYGSAGAGGGGGNVTLASIEAALSGLSTGLLKVTNGNGTLTSIAVPNGVVVGNGVTLSAATNLQDLAYATKPGVLNESYSYAADTGAANAYVVTLSPAATAYVAGMQVSFLASASNTSSSTLDVNGLGAVAIKKNAGVTPLSIGDIVAGQVVVVSYDGTQFQLISGAGSGGSSAGAFRFVAGNYTANNADYTICAGPVSPVSFANTTINLPPNPPAGLIINVTVPASLPHPLSTTINGNGRNIIVVQPDGGVVSSVTIGLGNPLGNTTTDAQSYRFLANVRGNDGSTVVWEGIPNVL